MGLSELRRQRGSLQQVCGSKFASLFEVTSCRFNDVLGFEIHFEKKAASYGLSADSLDRMKARGWTTLGAFAFATSSPPGLTGGEDVFWTQVGLNILKDPQSMELPGLRRLHYEAWITTSADMKYRLEKRDDDPPRKLPAIEREDRKERLQKNLGFGLKLSGENEPSHALVDLAVEMVETDALKRVPFEKCTSRDQELRGEKVDKRLTERPVRQGRLSRPHCRPRDRDASGDEEPLSTLLDC